MVPKDENGCPRHCYNDRVALREELGQVKQDRKESWKKAGVNVKWVLGILLVILGGAFMLLWNSQIGAIDKFNRVSETITNKLNNLTVVVTRIDERTKTKEEKRNTSKQE